MSENYFDPIVTGESNSPDTINTRLGDLDFAIFANNAALGSRLDSIVADGGSSGTEVVDARTAIKYKAGSPPATLSAALAFAAQDVANVKAFGAVGDGVTNDKDAIQNAVTNNAIIYFPPGIYITDGLTIPGNRLLFSNGGVTLLSTGGYCAILEGVDITIRNIDFQGADAGTGLRFYMNSIDLLNVEIDCCTFRNLDYAIRFAADQAARTAYHITIHNCTFTDLVTRAIAMLQFGGAFAYSLENIRIESNYFEDVAPDTSGKGGVGGTFAGAIYIGDLTSVKRFYLCDNIAIRCAPQFFAISASVAYNPRVDFVVSGNTVRQEGTSVIVNMSYTFTGVQNLIFADNTCSYVDYEHVYLNNCKNFKIVNCHFEYGNIGIAVSDFKYLDRSWGEISNCTFMDIECPSSENSGNKAIFISSDSAELDISNCNFIKQTGTKAQVGIDSNYTNTTAGNRVKWARVFGTTDYTWTLDGGSRYYLRRAGNVNPSIPMPIDVYESPATGTSVLTPGTIGSLNAGEWAYGDNNSLGYSTIYVRLAGSGAPGDNAVSASYPRLGLNVSHCRFGRMSTGVNSASAGNITYFTHVDVTSCVFIGCGRGINLVNSVGCLVAYSRFNGCGADINASSEMQGLRACYNAHFNSNPANSATGGAYVIDVGTGYNIWEISSCLFRNVKGIHVFAAGAAFSPRKRMVIFRDNDIDTASTGAPSNIAAISMITSANKILGASDTAPATGSDWVAGDIILNSDPSAGETLGWENVGAGVANSRPIQGQTYYRLGNVAPTVSATFIGEEFLDNAANKWYKAKATGTGASDWVALN